MRDNLRKAINKWTQKSDENNFEGIREVRVYKNDEGDDYRLEIAWKIEAKFQNKTQIITKLKLLQTVAQGENKEYKLLGADISNGDVSSFNDLCQIIEKEVMEEKEKGINEIVANIIK